MMRRIKQPRKRESEREREMKKKRWTSNKIKIRSICEQFNAPLASLKANTRKDQ